MYNSENISKHKHVIGICFGIVAAIVILVSQSFYYDYLASAEAGFHTEVEDEGEEDHAIITINKDVVTSAVQLTITQTLHFIADIHLDNAAQADIEIDQKVDFNTYFKTLFRLIISPNAP